MHFSGVQAGDRDSGHSAREQGCWELLSGELSLFCRIILWMDDMLHHLRNPGMNDSPINSSAQWLPMVSTWCRISSIRSMLFPEHSFEAYPKVSFNELHRARISGNVLLGPPVVPFLFHFFGAGFPYQNRRPETNIGYQLILTSQSWRP